MKKVYYLFILFFIVSCAQQSGLSGGEKDTEAPEVDDDRTFPKNGSINFKFNEITISFNEFIRLSNASQNIVVTPSLKTKPTFELKGKKINVRFQEELDKNTTYTINFGNSISDITEGNKLLNYNYVFSTGPILDSLVFKGSVYDAFHKTSKENILIGLYKGNGDSLGLKETPYYFTKSKSDGSFEFNNLKKGTYTILAINDENNNLKYDRFSEEVSFLDSTVSVNNDTLKVKYDLSLFKEEQSENWIEKKRYKHPGKINITLNKKADSVNIKLLNNTFAYGNNEENFTKTDSIYFWIKNLDSISELQLVTEIDSEVIDTIKLKINKPKLAKDSILRFKTNITNDLAYFEPVTLTFKTPILKINKEQITLINEDSTIVPFDVEFKDNLVKIKAKFQEDIDYELYINPNSFLDIYNKVNDSSHLYFTIIPTNRYGSIVLHYEIEEHENQQIIQLIKEGVVIEQYLIDSKSKVFEFNNLLPGVYQLKVINDSNNNGRWDTGDFVLKKQPELVKLFEDKIDLKAGWDLDLTWKN